MAATEYSKKLGTISREQFQAALDHFRLGKFLNAESIPFGLFGQNVFITSTSGEYVLRGAAHYEWQFPEEQFVAKLLHEQTNVPVPWPYLLDRTESIFGWKYGYVIMPRMPGFQLADEKAVKLLKHKDRLSIAYAMGENLREIQSVTWQSSGIYELKTKTIKPFKNGFVGWFEERFNELVKECISYDNGSISKDREWLQRLVKSSTEILEEPSQAVLVLHDYKESNAVAEKHADSWKISGVFDLMEALFGDGELDLVRQFAVYTEEDVELAKRFLEGYKRNGTLKKNAFERLSLFIAYDRMLIWEYFHRPEHLHMWWYGTKSPKEWIESYTDKLKIIV